MKDNFENKFKLRKLGENIPFEVSGHFHGWSAQDLSRRLDIFSLSMDTPNRNIREIVRALEKFEGEVKEPILLGSSILLTCSECGEAPVFRYYKGRFVADPCPYPKGMPPFSFELNIPSGKIVVENDLRSVFPITGSYHIGTATGEMKTTRGYARIGMAHGYVGNTCPAFQSKGDQNFYIVSGRAVKGARTRCHICTDLWWYSLCDFDELARRDPEWAASKDLNVVKCRPGVYKITQLYHTLRANRENKVYAKLEWVQEPDPVVDLQKEQREKNLTAGQVIAGALAKWGDGIKPRKAAILRKADHIMNVIGNGYDYHPNGWLGADPDLHKNSPSVRIPRFHGKQRWYPLCNYSAIAGGAGLGDRKDHYTFNKSFAKLAFNIVACMLIYGVEPIQQPGLTEKQKKKSEQYQLKWAWHIYLGLKKRYPNWIPDYAKDLPKPKIRGINIPHKA